jgi:hypothetical protein
MSHRRGKLRRDLPRFRYVRTATDRELLDQLDGLVSDAASGDLRAIGAVAIAFGPSLLREIRRELGALHTQDEVEVMQAFCVAMAEGKLMFPAIPGGALPWMKRMVRTFAQQRRVPGPAPNEDEKGAIDP